MDKIKIPIDITESEYRTLKKNLELFNNNLDKEMRLSFDEFVNLIFETNLLEEKLKSKYEHLNSLKSEIREIEKELKEKYSIGLDDESSEAVALRKDILKTSSNSISGLH